MTGKRVTVQLTHNSGVPGSEGLPGQIVECSEAQAKVWYSVNGAVEVARKPLKPETKPKRESDDKAAKRKDNAAK
jgi:hypothetical protein